MGKIGGFLWYNWGMEEKVFLVVNPGSSSERVALYRGEEEVSSLYFENETAEKLGEAKKIFAERGFSELLGRVDGVLVRIVAAGEYFLKNHAVDEETFAELTRARMTNPLHAPMAERAIRVAFEEFPGVPVILMSDAEALSGSRRDYDYALPERIVREFDFRRFGAHGASYGYIRSQLEERGLARGKMVVAHLGSGCSVAGIIDGEIAYTSMGETPLEGLMSSTRAGSVDPTIGAILGEKFGAAEAIQILNEESGLLAVAGTGNMKEVVERKEAGDARAEKAFSMFIDGVAGKIGEIAAKMGGADALIFTGTIGERSEPVRAAVAEKLEFMGLGDGRAKPILVIPTNEAAYMIKKANELIDAAK